MAQDVVVPEVGELGSDVKLVRWLRAPGDHIAVGDILFELDTDKAVLEVEAWVAGILADVQVGAGDTVSPRQVVARILAPGETADSHPAILPPPAPEGLVPPTVDHPPPSTAMPSPVTTSRAVGASPRARRRAQERGIPLETISGTGPGGLITERDVLDATERGSGG